MMRASEVLVLQTGRGEIPMYQRAIPVQHPHIALSERLEILEPSKARALGRAFIGQSPADIAVVGSVHCSWRPSVIAPQGEQRA